MKRACLSVVVILLVAPAVRGDVYIKEVNGTESYVLGLKTDTTWESISELWIGDAEIAYKTPGRGFIVDLDGQTFTVVNTENETYVTGSLPVDTAAILSDDLAERYRVWRRSGTVEATGDTVEMLGRDATEYEVRFWEVEHHKLSNEQTVHVWATTDVPFDWKRIDELLVPLRVLLNRDEALREELLEIRGVQLRVEWTDHELGGGRKHFTEVVEISEKEPPPGVYAVPEGFTRKERLSRDDL